MDVTDTFNRANTTGGLGTTSDGNATWVEPMFPTRSHWGITSNQAYDTDTSSHTNLAYVETSAANGTVAVKLPALASFYSGPMFRYVDTSNYWWVMCKSSNATLIKTVSGTDNGVGSTFTVAANDIISVEFNGSSLVVKKNGSTVSSVTDSFNATATKHGLYDDGTGPARFEDWSFVATVAPPWRAPSIRARRSQALMRSAVR